MKRVYLDHNATTPLSSQVRAVMQETFAIFGNASSMYDDGRRARKVIEAARAEVAELINAHPKEIIFTSGGSEANNTVFNIFAEEDFGDKNEIVVSAIEHPSVLVAAKKLAKKGWKVHYLSVDKVGKVRLDELKKNLNEKTALVSVMLANNEISTVQDVVKITTLAKKVGALVHTDAVQAVGKIGVDVESLGVDYLTLSAHKIYGSKGVGALFVREGAPFSPLIVGGHQEGGRRAGTDNTCQVAGFGAAAKLAKNMPEKYREVAGLRDELARRILAEIPFVVANGEGSLPNTLNVSFAGAEGESILLALDDAGVAVSTGSACASGDGKPSHVLMAIRADPELAHGSVRFGFGLENSLDDVEYVMKVLPEIVARFRAISTVKVGGENG
jgi:cysteine desulfurase